MKLEPTPQNHRIGSARLGTPLLEDAGASLANTIPHWYSRSAQLAPTLPYVISVSIGPENTRKHKPFLPLSNILTSTQLLRQGDVDIDTEQGGLRRNQSPQDNDQERRIETNHPVNPTKIPICV